MRIAAIAAETVRWPIGGTGAARGRSERAAVLLEVRSAEGVIGLGEAAPLPGMSADTLEAAQDAIAAFARQAPFTISDREEAFALAAGAPAAARFAIETALLDALARERGVALSELLRQTVDPRPAAGVTARLAAVVDDAAAARRARDAGIACLKIKLPADGDLRRVREIGVAVPDARLRLDANRGWPREEVARWLAPLAYPRFDYIEEPCRDAHLLLRDWLAVPLALDESLIELSEGELHAALGSGGLAALVLKPTVLGGLSAVRAMFALARQYRVGAVMSHGLEGPIGSAACAELALAYEADWQHLRMTEAITGIRRDAPQPVGLAAHPGLDGWRLAVPQLAEDHVHPASTAGLGFVGLDLAGAVAACGGAR